MEPMEKLWILEISRVHWRLVVEHLHNGFRDFPAAINDSTGCEQAQA